MQITDILQLFMHTSPCFVLFSYRRIVVFDLKRLQSQNPLHRLGQDRVNVRQSELLWLNA